MKALRRRTTAPIQRTEQRHIPDSEKVALATFEVEMGGRQALVTTLLQAALDPNGERFLRMLADPEHDVCSLAEVAVRAGVTLPKIMEWATAAIRAKSHLLAQRHIAEHSPMVAKAVMEDAIPGKRTCPTCQGLTTVVETKTKADGSETQEQKPCFECRGTGEITYHPELGVRKVALTLGGLLGSGAGKPSVVNNVAISNKNLNVANTAGASAAMDKMAQVTDALLYGVGRDRLATMRADADEEFVVEGETAEADDEDAATNEEGASS